MMTNNNSILKTGDWIKGNSWYGELIIGYIETLDIMDGVVKVTVIKSDNQLTVGKTIPMLINQVKRMPVSEAVNKEQIRFLIDLALSTGDEEWFIELSSQLVSMRELVNNLSE